MPNSNNIDEKLSIARDIVKLLEQGDAGQADILISQLSVEADVQLFKEVGQLTRELHEAINGFLLDDRVSQLAHDEIPDATERLHFVIKTTEEAANTTLSAIEVSMPLTDELVNQSQELSDQWSKFRNGKLNVDDFKSVSKDLTDFFDMVKENTGKIQSNLTEVTLAQSFQDITGQIISRVIDLVQDLEVRLVHLVKVSGQRYSEKQEMADDPSVLEGPVVPGVTKGNTVQGQDDVDDLLSSLGF